MQPNETPAQELPGEHLDERQLRALAALIRNSNVSQAADEAGVHRSTVHRWLQEPVFSQALSAAASQAHAQTLANLQVGTE